MNLPNQLTISRLLMTFIFVILASIPQEWQGEGLFWWKVGYVIAVLAAFTDFFDGYLARKLNLVTDFGKLMDPLSDKIYTLSCFIMFSYYHLVPFWVTCVILTREFAVTGLRTLAAKNGEVIAAKNIGKIKTVLQMLTLAFGGCIWVQWLEMDPTGKTTPVLYWVWQGILWSIAALTAYSGVEYYWKGRSLYLRDA